MNSIDPDEEVEHILELLAENPGLQLREIHNHLVEMDSSNFAYSPPRGEGYNDERYIVKGLIEFLSIKEEMITADATKWSLTKDGRKRIS